MIECIVIGASAGGIHALKAILPALPAAFALPLIIVQHMAADADAYLVEFLNKESAITVKEAEDKEALRPATAYIAPPDYHLLVNPDRTLSLSVDEKVHFARPSIDLLFETAADVFDRRLIGVILTGANADGAEGLARIKAGGGTTIVQNPLTAEVRTMPLAALETAQPDYILNLAQIAPLLVTLSEGESDYGITARQ